MKMEQECEEALENEDYAYQEFLEEQEFLKDCEQEEAMIENEKDNLIPPYSPMLIEHFKHLSDGCSGL
jgi:hypothetical protein